MELLLSSVYNIFKFKAKCGRNNSPVQLSRFVLLNLNLNNFHSLLILINEDFTRDGYVSTFEFNYFIQWFGPLTHSFSYLSRAYTDG